MLYDDDALYIGGRFWDSEPDLIAAGTLRHRSLRLGDDDRIAVVLSPYNDRRSGYKFETNANGVKHEAIYQNVSQNLSVWDTIWDVASTMDSDGWITEIAIPLKSISFDPENDTWGINFSRAVRRKGEEITWVSRNRSYNPSIVGLATGLTGLQQGLGLDVVPAVALNRRRVFEPSGDTSMTRPSLDLFYKVTPSLNGALTLNTDFSATEVDSRQVNLTRFNLFFPERRAFFLQDTDIFEFGRIGGQGSNVNRSTSGSSRQNGRPFFSRRLGLSDSGQPVDDRAFGLGLRAPNRSGLRWGLATREIQSNFNPALGYVNRAGIRDRTGDFGYAHFFRSGPIVSYAARIDAQRIELLDGGVDYRSGDFFGGERVNLATNVDWRPSKHFTFRLAYDWNDIRLPQGAFVTRLAQLTTEVAFNSDLSWINLVQYDNVTEQAGINSRLHWVLQDGREAYLVLNHNLQDYDRDNSFDKSLSDLSLKASYTFRF